MPSSPIRKLLVAAFIALGILAASCPLQAQSRGGSSSGRSYSSGSSSRSSSSSSRSSSSSSSGRSYSSGRSSSTSSSSSSSRPSGGASSGRSYSSGSSSASRPSSTSPSMSSSSPGRPSSTFSRPSATGQKPSGGFDSAASRVQRQAESKNSYTARSNPSGSTGRATPEAWPTSKPASSGKRYSSADSGSAKSSSGRSYSTSTTGAGGAAGKRPDAGGFDSSAAAAQRREESKAVFQKSQTPKPTYTDPGGTTRKIDPRDRTVEELRRDWTYETWRTREERRRRASERSPIPVPQAQPPVVVYRDPFSNWFWWWLLAQNLDTRAHWTYHHRDHIDEARYREMLRRDSQLEARVKQLEAEKIQRDPAHVPTGVDRDLMYDDAYVDAVVNPQPAPVPGPPASAHAKRSWTFLKVFLIVGVIAFAIWLVFIKRWGGSPN